MKIKITLLFLFALFIGRAIGQKAESDTTVTQAKSNNLGRLNMDNASRYYGGISFNYLSNSPELYSYSSQNSIDGESFGWHDWTNEEITEFNDYVRTEHTWMAPSLLFGMKILDKPESRWALTGELILGYLIHKHNEIDRHTETTLFEIKNDGKVNVFSSLNFNLKYGIQKWHLAINPTFNFGFNQSERIAYNYLPESSTDKDYHMKSLLYYPKVNLTGGYSFSSLNIYAGAGLGAYYTKQDLEISKATTNQIFKDEITIIFKGKSNINALVGFDWLIAEKFLLKINSEFGTNIMGQASLSILF